MDIVIKNALCISCLKPADVFNQGLVFCKSCYEWLGWHCVPMKTLKSGGMRTIDALNAHLAGHEIE